MSNKMDTTDMEQDTAGGLLPKLRFPEFQDAPEWEEKRLGYVCEKIMDGTHFSPKSKSGPCIYLTSKNIQNGIIDLSNISYITEQEHRQIYAKCPVRKNDVLLTKDGANTGNCALNNLDVEFSLLSSVAVLRGNPFLLDQRFLYQAILSDGTQRLIQASMSGQAITRITLEKIGNFSISMTCTKEQQKIADCLSSIDELITAQSQKLDALKTHKKGLMQQLFPAEGQTLPQLRFPEFQDAPEWEEIKLIDVASKKVKWSFIGGPFGSNLKASDYTKNGIRIIQLQNIGDGEFIDDYRIFTSEQKADELLGCNIYPGDIILSKMGDPVARACLIPSNHKRYVMCSDGIRLVVDEKKFNKFFIYSFINSAQFRRLAEKAATGSTRKRIGIDELKNQSVAVPRLIEQQKIADCLSSLDDLITAQSQKIAALKTHKKGLMQQLFPSSDEARA